MGDTNQPWFAGMSHAEAKAYILEARKAVETLKSNIETVEKRFKIKVAE